MQCWLNGEIVDANEARVSPFDRAFLFGDGVYEVIEYFNRTGVGATLHVERLRRSLQSAGIEGFDAESTQEIGEALLDASGLFDAIVYLQVSRGVQIPRAHLPKRGSAPTVFGYAVPAPSLAEFTAPRSLSAVLLPDERWRRCSIKSTSLIANVLAAIEGARHGAEEVILQRDGLVTEGSTTNVFVVRDGRISTPPVDSEPSILAGVTRALLIEAGRRNGIRIDERSIATTELKSAQEIFITSTRRLVDAVVRLDGRVVGTGSPGPRTCELFDGLKQSIAVTCGSPLHSPV